MPQGIAPPEMADGGDVIHYATTLHHNTRFALERRMVQKWGWVGATALSCGVAGYFGAVFVSTILWPLALVGPVYAAVTARKWYQSVTAIDLLKKQANLLEKALLSRH